MDKSSHFPVVFKRELIQSFSSPLLNELYQLVIHSTGWPYSNIISILGDTVVKYPQSVMTHTMHVLKNEHAHIN